MTAPAFRFVSRPAHEIAPRIRLDRVQQRVVEHIGGPLLVHGGPGTGKTTVLIESVAARVAAGTAPDRILVLGFGRRGASRLRHRITRRLDRTGPEVAVHSFPALAFAILRLAAAHRDAPAPRLLTGPEQDLMIRELLATADVTWPDSVKPALATQSFVEQLRDLLQRATERGLSPKRLIDLGHRFDRPEWVAAADFLSRYVDVLAVSSVSEGAAYDSAEIIRAAAHELSTEPSLLPRFDHVFVDEVQEVDPAQWELLELIASGGGNLIAFGDSDSATYGFAGGDVSAMREFGSRFRTVTGASAPEETLPVCYRSAKAPHRSISAVASRLRGGNRHRIHRTPEEVGDGAVDAVVLPSGTQQAAYIAQLLRRTHLVEGVPWSRMAVLVKSPTEHLPQIERSLRHSGVPVHVPADDTALSAKPIVASLLTIIRCGISPEHLDEATAVSLLHSPYGRADALSERRLRQELRRRAVSSDSFRDSGELLTEALHHPDLLEADTEWARPALRIARLMEIARSARGSVESVLWQVWDATGLSDELAARALSADSRAVAADHDLDAMMTLFEWAAGFTDRFPGAEADVFCDHVMQQVLPADSRARQGHRGEAVHVTTAHRAKGLEWDLVVVAGVQEGRWPNLRPRGSLMGAEALVDAARGDSPDELNTIAALLEEERRLFHAACGRARDRLVVTAVDDGDESQPSRFVDELDVDLHVVTTLPEPLTLPALVARLRTTVVDPDHPQRSDAVAALSRLAAHGVPGADPQDWWGLRPLSDDRPLRLPGERVRVTPSTMEKIDQCGLRWVLERHGGNESAALPQRVGDLIHAAAEHASRHPDPREAMRTFVDRRLGLLPFEAPWKAVDDTRRINDMVDKFGGWLADNKRTFVAAEADFTVPLPPTADGVTAELSGSVDRLERDEQGRLHVVDIKTARSPISVNDAATNLQLAAYQLAVEAGAFKSLTEGTRPGGASLVYPGTSNKQAAERTQPPLSSSTDPSWARDKVTEVAEKMAGATFLAVHSKKCDTCAVKQACPISGNGRPVTR